MNKTLAFILSSIVFSHILFGESYFLRSESNLNDTVLEQRISVLEQRLGMSTSGFRFNYPDDMTLTIVVLAYRNGEFDQASSSSGNMSFYSRGKNVDVPFLVINNVKQKTNPYNHITLRVGNGILWFHLEKPKGAKSGGSNIFQQKNMEEGKEYLIRKAHSTANNMKLEYFVSAILTKQKKNGHSNNYWKTEEKPIAYYSKYR